MIFTDEEQIEKAKLAGIIASKALLYGRSLIKPGEKIVDVLDQVESFIEKQGGHMAFPAQISLNETAAHFCPLANDPLAFKPTDIIKLDVGVHVDGYIADNALTIIFKEDNDRYEELHTIKKASEEALKNALKAIAPGVTLGEVGTVIQETIATYDLSTIRNLSGHGLGKYSVHEEPNIPNFNTRDVTELSYNQIIAVEPFATNGHGMIQESNNPTLFSLHGKNNVRSTYAREVLHDIQIYRELPFTTRWLKGSEGKIRLGLSELQKARILHSYPPLVEVAKGMVGQSEHTVIVRDKPIITTAREE